MNITVNGETRQLPERCSLAQLLDQLQLAGKRLAVERNGAIVPRSRYTETALAEGDRLEVVHAIGGG